jgi:patatin-like phospholipase/acyl hydrolase
MITDAVLQIDGGGVRGLTTLLILKRLMYLIRPNEDDYKLPKPCDHFDMIAGTSTGGLIAIMLGRLVRWQLVQAQ